MAASNTASAPAGTDQDQRTSRSYIGCVACTLLAVACVIDHGARTIDFAEWPGLTAILCLVVGMPHGALDMELLKTNRLRSSDRFWLVGLLLGYVSIAFATLMVWWLVPGLALICFLVLSAYHFGGDWTGLRGSLERIVVGAAVLTAPAAFHTEGVAMIFAWLVPLPAAGVISFAMALVSVPLIFGVGAVIALKGYAHRAQSEEIVAVVLAAVVLPPLTFFVIYFCALHSMRHLVDARRELATQTVGSLSARGAPYALVAMGCCVAGVVLLPHLTLGKALLSATFVGLAALTVPHMLLRELP